MVNDDLNAIRDAVRRATRTSGAQAPDRPRRTAQPAARPPAPVRRPPVQVSRGPRPRVDAAPWFVTLGYVAAFAAGAILSDVLLEAAPNVPASIARLFAGRGRTRRVRVSPFLLACCLLSVFHFAPIVGRDANPTLRDEPLQTIAAGAYVDAVTASPDGRYVYIAHANPSTILVLDASTNEITGRVPLPATPEDMAFAPNGSKIYLADSFESTVSTMNTTDHSITSAVAVAEYHYQKSVAVTPNGRRIYATDSYGNTVSVIDARTGAVTTTIRLGDESVGPWDIAITPDGRHAYATNPQSGTVSVIDTSSNTVVTTIRTGGYPRHIVITPDGRSAFVSEPGNDVVSVIDTATNEVTAAIAAGESPDALAIAGDGSHVFVLNDVPGRSGWDLWLYGPSTDTVSVIATASNTVVRTISMGDNLTAVASNFDGSRIYVADSGFSTLSVVDPNAG